MNSVTPISVPWMVSSTERELKIVNCEDGSLEVGFLGFYGKVQVDKELVDKYEDVKVIFVGVNDFRHYPDYSSEEAERLDSYDWDPVPEFRDAEGSLAQHSEKFHDVWIETKLCPDPAVYEVLESDWVRSDGNDQRLKHYIVLGGDYNLEVLAKGIEGQLGKK